MKEKKNEEPLLLCPRCKINMRKLSKGDVFLDICPQCGGMWLDKDEIPKLASMAPEVKKK